MKIVFLGGTCNGSQWRENLIEYLTIGYFNPVVPDWNEAAYQAELQARDQSDLCLYYITPKMTGVYSIAELVDDSNKRPEKTVFFFAPRDEDKEFEGHQIKALQAVGKMVTKNGGYWATDFTDLIKYLNK